MVVIDKLYLAVLTRNDENAGTTSSLNLTINIDGRDVVDYDVQGTTRDSTGDDYPTIERGEAAMYIMPNGPSLVLV